MPAAGDPDRFAGVKLLLDEMYPRRLAELLRDSGHDVVAVVELTELVGQPDTEVARWAGGEGRVVVTENVVDFVSLDPAGHAGLLLVNARRWPRTPAGIPRLHEAITAWMAGGRRGHDGAVSWL